MSRANYRRLAIAYCVVILLLSSIPGRALANIRLLSWDKLLHIIEYSILGGLLIQSLEQKTLRSMVLVMFIGVVFGAFDEMWQLTISGRSAHVYDWFADVAGIVIGGTVAILITPRMSNESAIGS